MQDLSHAPVIYHGLLAVFGALVHALDAHRKGNSKSFIDFISLIIMSSFSGVMFALIGLNWFPESIYLTTAMAGTGGYIGVEGMAWVRAVIVKRFKL